MLLERPLEDMLADCDYSFPFMLHWANGSWYKKLWSSDVKDELLIEQTYPGDEDAIAHFAYKDSRYIRIDGKIPFAIDLPLNSPEIISIVALWRELAKKEGIGEFLFIAHAAHRKEASILREEGADALLGPNGPYQGAFDAAMDSQYRKPVYEGIGGKAKFVLRKIERIFPEIFPRFDHSPRSHGKELIYVGDTPELFEEYVSGAIEYVRNKSSERQSIFIRAWNEWGEGNYLEPDLTTGCGYLEAISRARSKMQW